MQSIAIGVAALMALVIAAFAVQPQQGVVSGVAAVQPENQAEPEGAEKIEEKFVYIQMKTTEGEIFLELNNEKAPISVENFVAYAQDEFYDGTIFHRVIPNFMIQGGGFDKDMNQKKVREGIKNEWKNGLSNTRGSIAMARLGGRPDSATAQFFINLVDNDFLNFTSENAQGYGYCVFGEGRHHPWL